MKLRIKITGFRIHEVGYRVFLLRRALGLGIERFDAFNTVENGVQTVNVLVDGPDNLIAEFKAFAELGRPEGADVSRIVSEKLEGNVISAVDYMHLLNVEQLSKGIPAILRIDRKQDMMLGKLDDVRADVVGEIRELRRDIKEDELVRMKNDIAQIKAKLGL